MVKELTERGMWSRKSSVFPRVPQGTSSPENIHKNVQPQPDFAAVRAGVLSQEGQDRPTFQVRKDIFSFDPLPLPLFLKSWLGHPCFALLFSLVEANSSRPQTSGEFIFISTAEIN